MFPLHYHSSTVFSTPPPPLPHFHRFAVNSTIIITTTTFLVFPLHHHHHHHHHHILTVFSPPSHRHHHYHISIAFPPTPPPHYISIIFTQRAPDVHCFPSSTSTTTFLLFSLHHRHQYCISVVSPPLPPLMFTTTTTTTTKFLLLSLHRHHTNPTTSFPFIPSAINPTFLLFSHHHRMHRLYRKPDRPKPVQKCSDKVKISNWNNGGAIYKICIITLRLCVFKSRASQRLFLWQHESTNEYFP